MGTFLAQVRFLPVLQKFKIMAKSKTEKKVIAKFTGKGFRITPNLKLEHSSTQLYIDQPSFINSIHDETGMDALNEFASAIFKTLKNPRIKPGSLRITFQILEK
jgi:hypothetical protein